MGLLDRIKTETEEFVRELGGDELNFDYLTEDFVFEQLSEGRYPDLSDLEKGEADAGGPEFTIIYGSKIFRLGSTVHFLWVDRNNNWRCTNQAKRVDRVFRVTLAPASCSGYPVYMIWHN